MVARESLLFVLGTTEIKRLVTVSANGHSKRKWHALFVIGKIQLFKSAVVLVLPDRTM